MQQLSCLPEIFQVGIFFDDVDDPKNGGDHRHVQPRSELVYISQSRSISLRLEHEASLLRRRVPCPACISLVPVWVFAMGSCSVDEDMAEVAERPYLSHTLQYMGATPVA